MTLDEILDQQNIIRAELARMDDSPDTTEDDHGNLRDELIRRWKELDAKREPLVKQLEDLKLIARSAEDPRNTESGDGAATARRWDGKAPEFMRHRDPHEDLDAVRMNMVPRKDLVERALTSAEQHHKKGLLPSDRAGHATVLAQSNPLIARHMLLTGSDEYVEAFRAYLDDPMGYGKQEAERSLAIGTGGAGYMLPWVLDPTIVLYSSGSANPFRRIGRVVQTTSNAWNGVSSAGVNAQWLAESATAADASPTIGAIPIYVQKGAAWVNLTLEARDDSSFSDQLPALFADARDRIEEAAFAVATGGTGNSAVPKGIMPALGTGQRVFAQASGGALWGTGQAPALDVYNTQAKLAPRWRQSNSCAWVANITNINKVRSLDQYGGSSWWANFGQAVPEQLLGKPIYESTSITSSTAVGTAAVTGNAVLVFGAWENFIIVDRIGASMLYMPMLTSTAAAGVPDGRSGWFYFWRVGSDVATSSAFAWLANASG